MVAKVSLLGIGVDPVDMRSTIAAITGIIGKRSNGYICLAPAHSLMSARAHPELRSVFNRSSFTVPDGMGTVWFLRLLGYRAGRVYGPDLMLAACQHGAALGWRHYFLGGAPGVAERLIARLQKEVPTFQVAGFYAPPFASQSAAENAAMLQRINDSQVDILWVGLGSPKQEFWMAKFREKINTPVLIGVGAAFDFLSAAKPQAPLWMQRAGLEWVFRLATEPRRLWRRYAAYPWFVILAFSQWLGLAKYPLEEAS